MKIRSLILIILFTQGVCFSQISFRTLSKAIYKLAKNNDRSTFHLSKLNFKGRQFLQKVERERIGQQPIDTLYLVEGYDLESGDVVATIWSNRWKYNYRYRKKEIRIIDQNLFSEELYHQTMLGKEKVTLQKNQAIDGIFGTTKKVWSGRKGITIISYSFQE